MIKEIVLLTFLLAVCAAMPADNIVATDLAVGADPNGPVAIDAEADEILEGAEHHRRWGGYGGYGRGYGGGWGHRGHGWGHRGGYGCCG